MNIMNRQSLSFLQEFDEHFWNELEINYSRLKELVSENQTNQCNRLSGIHKVAVEIMCAFLDEPYSKSKLDTLKRIGGANQTPICIMLALKEFLVRKESSIVLSYFAELKRGNIPAKVNKYYNLTRRKSNENQDYERLLLLLLFSKHDKSQPHVLKQILALNTLSSGNTPTYQQTKGITMDRYDLEREMGRILKKLKADDKKNMDYIRFCDFEKDGNVYCFIKRQVDDKIERQIRDNIRSKPAELLSYTFIGKGKGLQIRASRSWIAENSIEAIQKTILGGNAHFKLDFPAVSTQDFKDFAKNALKKVRELKLLAIQIKNSPFKGAPFVRIWSESDIGECLSQLNGLGFNLLEPEHLEKIVLDFKGKREKITFDMGKMTVPTYKGERLSTSEQDEFENLVKKEFGFPVVPG
jgi:hypothetical protein